MPTENPKISAYVPQVIYDHFKEFQSRRELSMSQAAIEIFAHYFGINLEASKQEFTGGLPGKLMEVERSLTELRELYLQLAFKVEYIQSTSGLQNSNGLENLNHQQVDTSELLSKAKSVLQADSNEPDKESKLPDNLKSELPDKEHSELPVQLNFIDSPSDSPSSSLKEVSLPGTKLAERLSINRSTLSSRSKKNSVEDFADMTSQTDPDSIKWTYSEELKCYVPYEELSSLQVESLKAWKELNSTK